MDIIGLRQFNGFKISVVYFYTVKKQLQICMNRFFYKLRLHAIDLFETKIQEVKNHNYTLFTSKAIHKLHLEDFDSFRFVFIDGIYHYDSKISIGSLSKVFYLKEYAIKAGISCDRFFYKEVSIFSKEGIYLHIKCGMFVEKPIEILYVSTRECFKKFYPINIILLEKGSCVKIFERHNNLSLDKEKFIISSVTKIYMNAYSYLGFCNFKDDRHTAYFLENTYLLQEYRSECKINNFSLYEKSIINLLYIYQRGKEIHSHINGLNILQGYVNHNTIIEHILSYGKSKYVYKGILSKMANTNINGKIIVLNTAKKTNASQKNSNILLSNEAKVNASPQLEIFADDVKCSHGCIIGQLKHQEIFYLRSRGISKAESIKTLLFAFAKSFLECLSFQKLKNLISKKINNHVIHSRN